MGTAAVRATRGRRPGRSEQEALVRDPCRRITRKQGPKVASALRKSRTTTQTGERIRVPHHATAVGLLARQKRAIESDLVDKTSDSSVAVTPSRRVVDGRDPQHVTGRFQHQRRGGQTLTNRLRPATTAVISGAIHRKAGSSQGKKVQSTTPGGLRQRRRNTEANFPIHRSAHLRLLAAEVADGALHRKDRVTKARLRGGAPATTRRPETLHLRLAASTRTWPVVVASGAASTPCKPHSRTSRSTATASMQATQETSHSRHRTARLSRRSTAHQRDSPPIPTQADGARGTARNSRLKSMFIIQKMLTSRTLTRHTDSIRSSITRARRFLRRPGRAVTSSHSHRRTGRRPARCSMARFEADSGVVAAAGLGETVSTVPAEVPIVEPAASRRASGILPSHKDHAVNSLEKMRAITQGRSLGPTLPMSPAEVRRMPWRWTTIIYSGHLKTCR